MESISTNIYAQLLKKTSCFSFCSLALDGSKNICDVEQLAVWMKTLIDIGIDIFKKFLN